MRRRRGQTGGAANAALGGRRGGRTEAGPGVGSVVGPSTRRPRPPRSAALLPGVPRCGPGESARMWGSRGADPGPGSSASRGPGAAPDLQAAGACHSQAPAAPPGTPTPDHALPRLARVCHALSRPTDGVGCPLSHLPYNNPRKLSFEHHLLDVSGWRRGSSAWLSYLFPSVSPGGKRPSREAQPRTATRSHRKAKVVGSNPASDVLAVLRHSTARPNTDGAVSNVQWPANLSATFTAECCPRATFSCEKCWPSWARDATARLLHDVPSPPRPPPTAPPQPAAGWGWRGAL